MLFHSSSYCDTSALAAQKHIRKEKKQEVNLVRKTTKEIVGQLD